MPAPVAEVTVYPLSSACGHDHRLDHSNLQESQLATVDSEYLAENLLQEHQLGRSGTGRARQPTPPGSTMPGSAGVLAGPLKQPTPQDSTIPQFRRRLSVGSKAYLWQKSQ